MKSIYKKITIGDIESVLKDFPELNYPKCHGNGIYELSKGCFTGRLGMKEFNKQMKDLVHSFKI